MPNLEQYYRKILNEIKARPVGILALLYPYVLTVGVIIGLIYVSNLNETSRVKIPAKVPDSVAVGDLKVVEPKVVPPVDIMAASQPIPELIEKGKGIFTTVCQACHGAEGKGDGPGSTGLNPPPRNFTLLQNWKNGPKISQIYKTLQEGIPGSAMVAYDYLLPEEKIGLAHYIRQTFVPNPPKDTQDELTQLDQTYQLSKGQTVSAQVPVAVALNIVSRENSENVKKIINVESLISKDSNEEGSRIFNKVTNNQTRALTLLSKSSEWKSNQHLFVSSIVNGLNQNGFNSNIFKLDNNEWTTLQSYLSKYF